MDLLYFFDHFSMFTRGLWQLNPTSAVPRQGSLDWWLERGEGRSDLAPKFKHRFKQGI